MNKPSRHRIEEGIGCTFSTRKTNGLRENEGINFDIRKYEKENKNRLIILKKL